MDLIDIFWFCLAIWVISQIINAIIDGITINQITNRIERLKYLNDIIHQVKIETHNGVDYWYDKDDAEFLGQGKSMEEIVSVLKSRFPDHVFLLGELGGLGKKTDWQLMKPDEFKEKLEREKL
jgi:hypothetical protein